MSQSHQLPNVEIDPRTLDLWCLEYLFHVGAMSSDHVVERIEELFSSSLDARRDNVNRNDGTRSAENESLDALAAAEDARNWSYKLGVIKNVLSWVMDGNIEKALEAIRRDAPEILKNQRLGFLLHKQQFTELVRTANGDPSSIQEAITYLQTHLAQNDLASSAYPKEYAQLKRAMLMLLFQPRPGSKEIDVRGGGATPIDEWLGNEWSLDSREQLAGMLRKGLLQYFGIGEPKLSLLLRYLTLSHNMFYILYANGDQSPVQQYSDFFLISHDGVDNDDLDLDFPEEKGKAVGSADSCSSSISDREISVLAQSAGISPQKARSSLTRAASQLLQGHSQMSVDEPDTAGGESAMFMMLWKQDPRGFSGLEIAMKAEVSRMRIGHTQLIDLVKSYCQRRGLLSPEEVMPLDKSLNLLDVRRSQHIRNCRTAMQATIDDLIKTLPTYAVDEGAPIRPGGRSGTVTQRLVELVDRFLTQELVSDHPSNTNPIDELSAPLSKISVSNGRKRYDITEFAVSSSSNGSTSQPSLPLSDAPFMQLVEPTSATVEIRKRDDDSHDKSDEEVAFQERKSKRSVVLAESITEAATGVPRKSWREPRSDDRGTDDEYMDWTLAKACARGWSESVVLAMMRAKVIECCLCAAYAECENEIRTANQGESESIDRAENNKDSLSMSGMVGSAHGWAGVYWELALMNLRDLTNATAEADVNRTMYAEAIREASSLVALRYHTAFMVSSNNPEGPEKAKTRKATLSHHFRLLHGLLTKLVDGPICNMISAKHFGEEAAESVTPSLSSPTSEQPAPDSVAEDLTDDEGRQRGRALLDAGRVAAERSPRGRPRRRRGRGGSTSVSSKKATPPTITDMDGIFDGEDSQDEGNEIEEDTLVWILKSMLGIHVRLFQLKWENDPFEFVFCIDELRNTNDLEMFLSGEPLLTFLRKDSANISERKAAASAGGSSSALLGRSTVVSTSESTWGSRQRRTDSTQAPVENPRNESADDDSEDGENDLDEGSISLLMEMMAFTRPEAVRTLMDHGGDVMSVISALIT